LQTGLINEGFGQGDQTELSSAFWETAFLLTDSTSGIDVMITIFCDFRQFSVKKLAIFGEKIGIFLKNQMS
jgi:hypothetical protein